MGLLGKADQAEQPRSPATDKEALWVFQKEI